MMNTNKPEKELTGYPSIDKPWLKYYNSWAKTTSLPDKSIFDFMYDNNKDYPNDIAIIYFGRKITFAQFFEEIDKCARSLIAIGVKENDIVTVALPCIPESLYAVYAINKIGAVANMIHPLAGNNEIINYLNEVKCEVCIMLDGTYEIVGKFLNKTNIKHSVVVSVADSLPQVKKILYEIHPRKKIHVDKKLKWKAFIDCGKNVIYNHAKWDNDATAIISHTGGTSGEPKGVMLSNNSTNAVIWQIGYTLPHKRQERQLCVLPPFINYALVNGMLEPIGLGFTAILIPKYMPDKFDMYIRKYRPNFITSIPAYWKPLLTNKRLKKMDLSCLKYYVAGGDGLTNKLEEELNAFFKAHNTPLKIAKGFGCTELVSSATYSYEICNKIGSVGIPLVKLNCKIVDPKTNEELIYNEEGEICFSGNTVMIGYYMNKEATDDMVKLHSDGEKWLHTGDLGYITEDGLLYVTGRIKRIIMTKGNDGMITKIFPDRIEKVLLQHEAVALCCTVGIPDETRIFFPRAFVVLKEGFEKNEGLTKELTEKCNGNLPGYMIPDIKYLDEMPLTKRGKVDYRMLEKMAESQNRGE